MSQSELKLRKIELRQANLVGLLLDAKHDRDISNEMKRKSRIFVWFLKTSYFKANTKSKW